MFLLTANSYLLVNFHFVLRVRVMSWRRWWWRWVGGASGLFGDQQLPLRVGLKQVCSGLLPSRPLGWIGGWRKVRKVKVVIHMVQRVYNVEILTSVGV